MAQKKFMNLEALRYYDEKLKAYVAEKDAAALQAAKDYSDSLADNYDAVGTAQTKVDELANGAVKANADAIAKLNGDATTDGSVAKAVADAKALVDADVDAVEAKADANAADITALNGRMNTAEADINAIEEDMGNVDNLATTKKNLVEAINEVRKSVSDGGVSAAVTMDTTTTTDGALKSYTIKQGENVVGVIDIPKDMVVESGSVVNLADGDVEGYAAGTYIKLVLANVAEPLYINVGTLVDIYKAQANATQVQVAINSDTREISATIVAGSIGSAELADNAVVTAKIADANVTKAKLSTAVQASLDKADASASQDSLDEEVNRAKAAEAQALTDAKAYTDALANGVVKANTDAIDAINNAETGILKQAKDYTDAQVKVEKERAEGIEAGLEERLAVVEAELGDGEGTVTAQIAKAKQEAIDAAAADATAKADAAEADANKYTDEKVAANKELIDANTGDITALKGRMDTAEGDIDALEKSLAEGGETANAIANAESNAKAHAESYADGLNDAMNERVEALENADTYVEITNGEIEALFATNA